GEFAFGWIIGGLVRALLTAAVVGVGRPPFRGVERTLFSGGGPAVFSRPRCWAVRLIFPGLGWGGPAEAGDVAGRGVGAALGGSDVLAGAATGARFALLGGQIALGAIRGASSLVHGAARMRGQFREGRGGTP